MKFIRTPTAAASLPALSDTGTEGYFQDGDPGTGTAATKFDAAWCNGIQGEIGAIVTEVGGVSRSGTTLNQAATALGGARGLKAHATDTGVVSTLNTRVVIGSTTSQAHGNGANVIVGSVNAEAEGSRTVILASQTSTADLIASSTRSALRVKSVPGIGWNFSSTRTHLSFCTLPFSPMNSTELTANSRSASWAGVALTAGALTE